MYPIYAFGGEEQKQRWLPRMAKGETIACFGLTEPHGGSDPGNMKTHAKRQGKDWVLNGAKMWITNAPIADVAIGALVIQHRYLAFHHLVLAGVEDPRPWPCSAAGVYLFLRQASQIRPARRLDPDEVAFAPAPTARSARPRCSAGAVGLAGPARRRLTRGMRVRRPCCCRQHQALFFAEHGADVGARRPRVMLLKWADADEVS